MYLLFRNSYIMSFFYLMAVYRDECVREDPLILMTFGPI